MPKRTSADWAFEIIAVSALIAGAHVLTKYWSSLPAQIPTHFGASGLPNSWGNKNQLLILPFTSMGVYVVMTLASRYQRLINLPFNVQREDPRTKELLLSMSIVLKMVVTLVFAYITRTTVYTALGRSEGLGRLFMPISLLMISSPLAWYGLKLRRRDV